MYCSHRYFRYENKRLIEHNYCPKITIYRDRIEYKALS